ncbi:MAG: FMN reductase [Corynebacteriales bacterium]|nr:FMN reductase [Mycobacteriales bacterium]
MEPLKLVVISAGLSQPSSTRLLADRLTSATRRHLDQSVEVRIVELRELASDIAHNMVTSFPSAALRDTIEATLAADGIIAVTPVFNASYSGLFKSFFDVLFFDTADETLLAGKPVLISATGGTARHSLALEHAIRPLFSYLHAMVVPTAVFAAPEDWGEGDAQTQGLARRIARAAGEFAELLKGKPVHERTKETVVPFAQQLAALRDEKQN